MQIHTNQIPTETATPSVAIDLEIFGMRKRKLHRPEGTFACLVISDGVDVWLFDREDMIQEALDSVKDHRWIMHNSQFDIFHLRRWADVPDRSPELLWDTMIIERLMYSGYYDGFSLSDLARRYLDIQMDKKARKMFEKATHLNARLRKYTADDGITTYRVYAHQYAEWINQARDGALSKLWELECETIFTVLDFKGFKVDEVGWNAVADAYEEQRDNIRAKLDFNPASPKQVQVALAKKGLNVKNTQAKTLEEHKDRPIVQSILKYRKAMKLAGTYGRKFIEDNMEEDGRVYASYRTLGAATGRMSSANPNMQNIPRAKEFRAGFVADRGHKLIVADYSQQEPRIAGFLSQDAALLGMFLDGKDIHLEVTRWIFDDPTIPRTDPRRYIGKTLNLAITYGLTAHSLAERVTTWNAQHGIQDIMTEYEAEKLISKYFLLFSGLSEWIDHMRYNGERDEYVETVMGRRVWLNHYNRQWPNNAINAPIQGGAADQMKLALNMFRKACKRLGWLFSVVSVVHDEIVAEAPEDIAEEMRDILIQCMTGAGFELYPEIPWKVDAEIGSSWASKA
jgi:DNA polymerase I-like protein with 3'-5' exonuclease and polymerase domains